jgi:hypothetical protein
MIDKQNDFEIAISRNNIEAVKILLKDSEVNPAYNDNWAIREASIYGFLELLKLLVKDKRTNVADGRNWAVRTAAIGNHYEMLKYLLTLHNVDPTAVANQAIKEAYVEQHEKIVRLLWNKKCVKRTLKEHDFLFFNICKKFDIKNKVMKF